MSATPNFQRSDDAHRPEAAQAFARECAFVSENIEAHAIGALPDDEATRVDRHVSTCPRCALLLDKSLAVSALLPFLAAPVAVPASARERLFSQIVLDRPAASAAPLPNLNPWQASEPERSWTIPSSKDAYAAAMPTLVNAPRKRRVNWDVWAAPLAAMPLVLALAIVGGWALNTRSSLEDQKNANRSAQTQIHNLTAQLLQNATATTTPATAAGITLDSVNSSGAKGSFTQLSNDQRVSVQVSNLPAGVKECEVEFEMMDGTRTPMGTLQIDANGSGAGTILLNQPLSDVRSVHVVPLKTYPGGNSSSTDGTADVLMAQINSSLGWPNGTDANSSSR